MTAKLNVFHRDADGKLVGQSVDMVREVCKLAEKQCKLLTVRRKDCWNDKVAPGYSKGTLSLMGMFYFLPVNYYFIYFSNTC